LASKRTKFKKKKKSRINPAEFIREKYDQYIEVSREVNPNLPSQWLDGSDKLIDLISTKVTVEECVGLWDISLDILRFILEKDDRFDPLGGFVIEEETVETKVVFNWYYLFELIRDKNHKEIKELCKSNGKLIVALGYLSIYIISLFRISLYLEGNPNPRDSLYIYYGNELEQDPKSKPCLEKALENLGKYTRYEYKALTKNPQSEPDTGAGKKIYIGSEEYFNEDLNKNIYSYVYKVVIESFGDRSDSRLTEDLIRAAEGDSNLRRIPEYTAKDFINEYYLYSERKDNTWVTQPEAGAEDIEKLKTINSIPGISNSKELIDSIELNNWIESIEDELNKNIARLRFIHGHTFRKISEELKVPRSTIGNRLKKLTPPIQI